MMKSFFLILFTMCCLARIGFAQNCSLAITQTIDTVYVGEWTSVASFHLVNGGPHCTPSEMQGMVGNDHFTFTYGNISCLETKPGPDTTSATASEITGDLCECGGSASGYGTIAVVAIVRESNVLPPSTEAPIVIAPNPFESSIAIVLSLQAPATGRFQLFDPMGRAVRSIERQMNSGPNEIELDGRNLPAGCYWYVLRAAEWVRSGKLLKIDP